MTTATTSRCPECGSANLIWDGTIAANNGAPQNNRLSINDVHAEIYLGCEECSATVEILDLDAVVSMLNMKERGELT